MNGILHDLLVHMTTRRGRDRFLAARKGAEFEERITEWLLDAGMSRINPDWKKRKREELKEWCQSYQEISMLQSEFHKNTFVMHPFGGHQYPDVLLFEEDRIHPVEVKFSKSGKIMWNGGLPRPHGIYILASLKHKDIHFFLGRDVVSMDEAKSIIRFQDQQSREVARWNKDNLGKQHYGFQIYSRRTVNQGMQSNPDAIIDLFKDPRREDLRRHVLEHVSIPTRGE